MTASGHELVEAYPKPSGWYARCECGETFRAPREHAVMDEWYAHRDEHETADVR